MSVFRPHQILKFTGNQSTLFLNSLITSPPSSWSDIQALDLTEVTFITPVICAFSAIARSRGWHIDFPEDHSAAGYLNYMLKADLSSSCERYTPITTCDTGDEVRTHAGSLRAIIDGWVPADTAEDFDYSLLELMNNVFDHSESPEGFWTQSQKYPERRCIEMVIVDSGIGISESLRQNPEFVHLSPLEGFTTALKLRVTSKPDQNAGEGLSSTLEWIKFNQSAGARGLILSREHLWFSGKSGSGTSSRGCVCWPGTFMWLSIPFTLENRLIDVWDILGLTPDY